MNESGAAALAATMADAADLAEIDRCCQLLNVVIAEKTLGVQEDCDFHLAIARASKNQFFVSVIASMQQQVLCSMNLMRNMSLVKSIARQKLVRAEHLAIVEALKRRDAQAAGAAMRRHLENAQERMFNR